MMTKTQRVTIELPEDLIAAVHGAVEIGDYPSEDAAIADALAGWNERRDLNTEDIERIKAAWQEAIDDPRPYLPMDEVFDRLEVKYQTLAEEASQTK